MDNRHEKKLFETWSTIAHWNITVSLLKSDSTECHHWVIWPLPGFSPSKPSHPGSAVPHPDGRWSQQGSLTDPTYVMVPVETRIPSRETNIEEGLNNSNELGIFPYMTSARSIWPHKQDSVVRKGGMCLTENAKMTSGHYIHDYPKNNVWCWNLASHFKSKKITEKRNRTEVIDEGWSLRKIKDETVRGK